MMIKMMMDSAIRDFAELWQNLATLVTRILAEPGLIA
jgi:hypothetical protein